MDNNHYLARAWGPKNASRGLTAAIHALAWGLMFALPLLFTQAGGGAVDWVGYAGYCMVPLMFMAVFYANYFGLIPRLLFRHRAVGFVALNVALIMAAVLLLHLWFQLFRELTVAWGVDQPAPHDPGPRMPRAVFWLRDGVMMGLTAALSVAIRVTGDWYRTEAERKQAEQDKAQAELLNLRSQLNPHFLFNTLNNIYALIAVGPERAQAAVLHLSGLLRHVLYDRESEAVPLAQELAFVQSYVDLMALRLPTTTELRADIPTGAGCGEGRAVAPLLFITLIENAFKHGVSADAAAFIDISIRVADEKNVVCRVANSSFPKRDGDRSGSGIGLDNLRRRLALLYPGEHTLNLSEQDHIFVAELSVKCREV